MILKRWVHKPALTPNQEEIANKLSLELFVDKKLSTLLTQRGITDFDSAKQFFRPNLAQLHDPFLMKDMDLAVARLAKAIKQGEKILIYGDYDVDGTTSVALFYGFIQNIYSNIDYYIPDRYAEGYGVSWQSIDWAQENGFTLIVTLDCGIKSVDKVLEAKKRGIDFIICDHHRPDDILPEAVAVLDPKRSDCAYPFKELTGCGVGFKLLQAFSADQKIDPNKVFEYLDLLVISIAADIVPIIGENRILAYYGLKRLNAAPHLGVKALADVAGLKGAIDITNVVFALSPRINAAGRIKHAKEAVRLLLCKNPEEAASFAKEIDLYNQDRRTFDSSITEEALKMIDEDDWFDTAKSTVLYKEDWHKGVVGIVASRCIEKHHRPTIILTQSHGKATGSARSVPGFDVYEAIEECADLLEQFGGHTFAAGLTLSVDNIKLFRQRFDEIVKNRILPEQLFPMITIDTELELKNVNQKFYNILRQMGPYGPENMTPIFESNEVKLKGKPTIMKEKHIKFEVQQGDGPSFTAIGFGMAQYAKNLIDADTFSICYQIEENNFRDQKTLQLFLKDIKFHSQTSTIA